MKKLLIITSLASASFNGIHKINAAESEKDKWALEEQRRAYEAFEQKRGYEQDALARAQEESRRLQELKEEEDFRKAVKLSTAFPVSEDSLSEEDEGLSDVDEELEKLDLGKLQEEIFVAVGELDSWADARKKRKEVVSEFLDMRIEEAGKKVNDLKKSQNALSQNVLKKSQSSPSSQRSPSPVKKDFSFNPEFVKQQEAIYASIKSSPGNSPKPENKILNPSPLINKPLSNSSNPKTYNLNFEDCADPDDPDDPRSQLVILESIITSPQSSPKIILKLLNPSLQDRENVSKNLETLPEERDRPGEKSLSSPLPVNDSSSAPEFKVVVEEDSLPLLSQPPLSPLKSLQEGSWIQLKEKNPLLSGVVGKALKRVIPKTILQKNPLLQRCPLKSQRRIAPQPLLQRRATF